LDDQIQIFYSWKKVEFFLINAIFLFLGLHEELSSDRRSLHVPKENIPHIQTWNFLTFFLFAQVTFAFLDPDPVSRTGSREDLVESGFIQDPQHFQKIRAN